MELAQTRLEQLEKALQQDDPKKKDGNPTKGQNPNGGGADQLSIRAESLRNGLCSSP